MRYILLAVLIIIASSCEKVINVKLDNAEKKYVIEGMLSDASNSCKVYITQTKDFNENNDFPGIAGAQVTITDGNNAPVVLTETSPGVYESNSITAVQNHTYTLKVEVNGQTFTASSTVPVKVAFDSLYVKETTFFDEKVKLLNFRYQDPVGKGNYYRFVQYINGKKDKTIFVRDDDLSDGRLINAQLFTSNDDDDDDDNPGKIKTGDSIKGEMYCIDAAVYKYWYSLDQSALGESQSASPANPVTNISGGALGYFSAHTYEAGTLTAP